MEKKQIYIALAFLAGIIYRLLMGLQGIDSVDVGFCMTFYQNIFSHPEAMTSYFNYYLTGIIGGAWQLAFGQFGLLGFRVLETVTMSTAVWLLYLAFHHWIPKTRTAVVAILLSFLFPSFVITFHYDTLSFLLMAASVCSLSQWFRKARPGWLFTAGVMIGLSFFTRNVSGALIALAAFPFYWGAQTSWRKGQTYAAFYVSGMAAGAVSVVVIMMILGHAPYYLAALQELVSGISDGESTPVSVDFWSGYFKSYINIGLQILVIAMMALYFGDTGLLKGRLRTAARVVMILGLFILVFTSQPYLSAVSFCTLLIVIAKDPLPLSFYALACAFLFPFGSGSSIPSVFHWCGGLLIIPAACCFQQLGSPWQRKVTRLLCLCIAITMIFKMVNHAYGERRSRMSTTVMALPGTLNTLTSPEHAERYRHEVSTIKKYAAPGDLLLIANQVSELYYATETLPFTGSTNLVTYMEDDLTERLNKQVERLEGMPVIVYLYRQLEGKEAEETADVRRVLEQWMSEHDYRKVHEDDDVKVFCSRIKK